MPLFDKELDEAIKRLHKELEKEAKKVRYRDILDSNNRTRDIINRGIQGGSPMGDINLCKIAGPMSVCDATKYKTSHEKFEQQKKCKFYIIATREKRCMFETFDEYCWCYQAQTEARKGM